LSADIIETLRLELSAGLADEGRPALHFARAVRFIMRQDKAGSGSRTTLCVSEM